MASPYLSTSTKQPRTQYLRRKQYRHTHGHHGHQRRQSGSVLSTPSEFDIEYLSPVTVGRQTLQLNMDTGSADLWVFSSELDHAIVASRPRPVYSPNTTTTAKNTSSSWFISYSDGSFASGRVVLDIVSVSNTTVLNQSVGVASRISNSFVHDEECDGILGPVFSSINTIQPVKQKTSFENALSKLSAGLFAVDLRHNASGSIDFGFINSTKYKGEITYVPLRNGSGFWQFQTSNRYYIDGKVQRSAIMSRGALADTGTTLLLMQPFNVSTYYKSVKGAGYSRSQGGHVFPCKSVLPTLSVAIDFSFVPIMGSLLNFGQISPTLCYGGLQDISATYPSVYGDIFFKAAFAIFDYQNHRFGYDKKNS